MKLRSSVPMKSRRNERGLALVLFLLSLPVLLGLATLALDTANLYIARQRVNKIARASAAAGLNIRGLRGWASFVASSDDCGDYGAKTGGDDPDHDSTTQSRKDLATVMSETSVSLINKIGSGEEKFIEVFDPTSKAWTPVSNPNSSSIFAKSLELKPANTSDPENIKIRYRYKVKTLFLSTFGKLLSMLPNTTMCESNGTRCYVYSDDTVTASVTPARIHLLLDTSGSMATTVGGKTKLQYLKEAVGQFIDAFNPYRDQISIIPFGHAVQGDARRTLATFSSAGSDGYLAIKDTVRALTAQGMTNHCDALIEAIEEIPDSDVNPHFVVLFTDGAPNTYRLRFCGDKLGTPDCGADPTALSGKTGGLETGWYGWTVLWDERKLQSLNGESVPTNNTDPNRDPVFGKPLFKKPDGTFTTSADVTNLFLDKDRNFMIGTENVISDKKWSLQFQGSTGYKWSGPSYLVHAGFPLAQYSSGVVDRVSVPVGAPTPITCGPPDGISEQYNHARYFASRVVNANWTLSGDGAKVGLTSLFPSSTFPSSIPVISYLKSSSSDPTPHPLPTANPGCLTNLNATIPGTDRTAALYVGGSFLSNTSTSPIGTFGEIVKTAELPYYCAVRAADYLRTNKNAIVFVVGLGQAPAVGEGCEDPMQNALDFSSRKDHFLRRLALAPEALKDPASFIGGDFSEWASGSDFRYGQYTLSNCPSHPLASQNVNLGYSDTPIASSPTPTTSKTGVTPSTFNPNQLGAYYPSNDPKQLNALFGKIAKQILVRLAN